MSLTLCLADFRLGAAAVYTVQEIIYPPAATPSVKIFWDLRVRGPLSSNMNVDDASWIRKNQKGKIFYYYNESVLVYTTAL